MSMPQPKYSKSTVGRCREGFYDDAHERRAVVCDYTGNGLVFYSPLARGPAQSNAGLTA